MGKLKPYNTGPVTARSVPFWTVGNPLGDPFGPGVLGSLTSLQVCELICQAADDGLIERTGFHDDDLVPWDPKRPEDDLVPKSETYETLRQIKCMLEEHGVLVNTATCNLHSDPLFRRGGLANPDKKIRNLANLKVARTIRIGHLLGARYLTYWVARDGFEVAESVPWKRGVYRMIADALNGACEYIRGNKFTNYIGGTIEPKPNEPRGHMFLPTAGHAVGFIQTMLNIPEFWGVNPELRQHEAMTLLDPVTCLAFLVDMGKLFFLHFGNQISGQFDNDFPPLVGPEGLKETAQMFWLLGQLGWKGVVEYDCHMLRCEGEPRDPIGCRKQFIENCSLGLQIALVLASRIDAREFQPNQESRTSLVSIMQMCDLAETGVLAEARKQILTGE